MFCWGKHWGMGECEPNRHNSKVFSYFVEVVHFLCYQLSLLNHSFLFSWVSEALHYFTSSIVGLLLLLKLFFYLKFNLSGVSYIIVMLISALQPCPLITPPHMWQWTTYFPLYLIYTKILIRPVRDGLTLLAQ